MLAFVCDMVSNYVRTERESLGYKLQEQLEIQPKVIHKSEQAKVQKLVSQNQMSYLKRKKKKHAGKTTEAIIFTHVCVCIYTGMLFLQLGK